MEKYHCREKPCFHEKIDLKNFSIRTNDGFGFLNPNYLSSIFIEETNKRTGGRTNARTNSFYYSASDPLLVEGIYIENVVVTAE